MNGSETGYGIVSGIMGTHSLKKPEKKRRSLIRLGVDAGLAYACSRSRMGGWRIAQSPILNSTLTVARLKQRGYIAMMEYYREQRSS